MPETLQDLLFIGFVAVVFYGLIKCGGPLERWLHARRQQRSVRP